MSSIFLSHSHADKPFVRRLAQDLQAAGVRVWLDEAEMMIGDSLIEKIRQGIDEMEYLGVILSPNSVNSPWVQREVDVAMNREIAGKRVKVLPLVIEDCKLPGFLEGKLYADFQAPERYDEELAKVLYRLGKTPSVIFPHPSIKRRRRWLFGTIGSVLILGLGLWLPQALKEPSTTPSLSSLRGHLQVNVNVDIARVSIDGKQVGIARHQAPLVLSNLKPGIVRILVEADGYEPQERRVSIIANEHAQVGFLLHQNMLTTPPDTSSR
jgi:hypothetical protein